MGSRVHTHPKTLATIIEPKPPEPTKRIVASGKK